MIDPETKDIKLPLAVMNPMGKDHALALLDQYLAFNADELVARAVAGAESNLSNVEGRFKVALVIADDDDELEYAREVIAPNLDSKDYPIIITSLFGDVAAASLGYAPLGLSERAGLALALRDARIMWSRENEL